MYENVQNPHDQVVTPSLRLDVASDEPLFEL